MSTGPHAPVTPGTVAPVEPSRSSYATRSMTAVAPVGPVLVASAEAIEAQGRLAQALAQARAGDDRALAVKVRQLGEQFVRMLTGALRMTRFHDLKNRAFDDPLREVSKALATLIDMLGPVQIVMVDGQVYINDLRVRFPADNDAGAAAVKVWSRHEVGGIVFGGPVPDGDWRKLVGLVAGDPPMDRSARAALSEKLFAAGITSIELQPVFRLRLGGEAMPDAVGGTADAVYVRASRALGSLWDQIALGRMVNTAAVRRVVTDLVDLDSEALDHTLLLSATEGTEQEDVAHETDAAPLYVRHSLAVAAVSLLIGRTLGLEENVLADLGLAAAFHDVGYASDDETKRGTMATHGSYAALELLAERGFHEARLHRMRVCLGHHRGLGTDGDAGTVPSLFARIVRIANDYDTLTRARPGVATTGPKASPPEVLGAMMAAAGTQYDPVLMQLFVNRVGKYPPGTLLELDDRTLVRVVSGVRRPAWFDRPLTHVVRNPDGTRDPSGKTVDLATSRRTVAGVRG